MKKTAGPGFAAPAVPPAAAPAPTGGPGRLDGLPGLEGGARAGCPGGSEGVAGLAASAIIASSGRQVGA